MIIKVLAENTSISNYFGSEHGLSIYIETKENKILFDVGASELFYRNAEKMGVDISEVKYLVLSHGHYDHGGGLKTFLEKNKTAEVFCQRLAFEKHYSERENDKLHDIGLRQDLKKSRQIVLSSDRFFIGKGIQLFSNVVQREHVSNINRGLLTEQYGKIVPDSFFHEQNLIIEEDGKTVLLVGCAHNGIVNILEHFHSIKKRMPDYVIGGFHLSILGTESKDLETIDGISEYLLGTKAKYFTCHCTGLEPYKRLKSLMGERISYLSGGSEIEI